MLLHRPNPLDAPLYRRRVAELSEIHRIVKALVEVRIAWKLTLMYGPAARCKWISSNWR